MGSKVSWFTYCLKRKIAICQPKTENLAIREKFLGKALDGSGSGAGIFVRAASMFTGFNIRKHRKSLVSRRFTIAALTF
ncbi:hypothetical protein BH18ACT10_BH18ACT10_11920 [soil metagenome]